MDKLSVSQFTVEEIYSSCIDNMRDKKALFEACKQEVLDYSALYENKIQNSGLLNLQQCTNMSNGMSKDIFEVLYTQKMVSGPSRIYYDSILSSANYGTCPYCGQNLASTLDHFLPKSKYLPLVVTPSNLIPCCKDCNTNKSDIFPIVDSDVLFNPYFEDIGEIVWLHGKIEHIDRKILIITFYVDLDNVENNILKNRLENYFKVFKLNDLYSKYAARGFINITKKHLIRIEKLGYLKAIISIKEDIDEAIKSFESTDKNSWESAAYRELRDDNWYIECYLKEYNNFNS